MYKIFLNTPDVHCKSNTQTHTRTHTCRQNTHTYTRTYTPAHTHAHTHTYAHTHAHMHTHTPTHIRTYRHTHTHNHLQSRQPVRWVHSIHVHGHIVPQAHVPRSMRTDHGHFTPASRTHRHTHKAHNLSLFCEMCRGHPISRLQTAHTHTHTHIYTCTHTYRHTYTHSTQLLITVVCKTCVQSLRLCPEYRTYMVMASPTHYTVLIRTCFKCRVGQNHVYIRCV